MLIKNTNEAYSFTHAHDHNVERDDLMSNLNQIEQLAWYVVALLFCEHQLPTQQHASMRTRRELIAHLLTLWWHAFVVKYGTCPNVDNSQKPRLGLLLTTMWQVWELNVEDVKGTRSWEPKRRFLEQDTNQSVRIHNMTKLGYCWCAT